MKAAYLFALLSLLPAGGCYSNPVNGEQGNFAFVGPGAAALGEPLVLRVAHDTKHLELCGKSDCSDLLSGVKAIESVLAVDCDVPDCTISAGAVEGGVVPIRVQCPGIARPKVHLQARLTDGSQLEDKYQVAFLAAARVGIYCPGGQHCGGRYGLFAGAGFDLYARAESEDGTALYTATIGAVVDSDAVGVSGMPVERMPTADAWVGPIHVNGNTMYPSWVLTFSTVHPGLAHVRLNAGTASREVTVNVADPNDIGDANLETKQSAGLDGNQFIDVDAEPAEPLGSDSLRVNGGALYGELLVTLRDGSRAWGGADFLTVDSHLHFGSRSDPPTFANSFIIISGTAPGVGHLHFDVGAAHREWPFTVDPPRHK